MAKVLNSFFNCMDPQAGHFVLVFPGLVLPTTRDSNRCPQVVQVYSKIGMGCTIPKGKGACLYGVRAGSM